MIGCPLCDGLETKSFNWLYESNKADSALSKYVDYSAWNTSKLKFGSLLECKVCAQGWYLSNEKEVCVFVPEPKKVALKNWSTKDLSVSDLVKEKIAEIGVTPPHTVNIISIPCKIILKTEESIDPAIVLLIKDFPKYLLCNSDCLLTNINFIDQVSSLEESEYAFPLSVRIATALAAEQRMGFAPSILQAPNRKLYCVNSTTTFFNSDGWKGPDMKFVDYDYFDRENACKVTSEDSSQISYFIGDWSAELGQLNSRYLEYPVNDIKWE